MADLIPNGENARPRRARKSAFRGTIATARDKQDAERIRENQAAFLSAYGRSGGNRAIACATVEIRFSLVKKWIQDDEEFRDRLADAEVEADGILMQEAYKRGVKGWQERDGVTKFSDRMLVLLMRTRRSLNGELRFPELHTHQIEMTGNVTHELSDEDRADAEKILGRRIADPSPN